ncbi:MULTISPECIES: GNAT family N-acetyltransferase [Stenotrophomonas]|uniref:GNAT family N-acetyltransferase n=1 Tax=Stenotrophomonas TaxID=40323 RepID=UPI0021C9EE45|nr:MULTISPECIES: GNAT family N-acetyltransferase [Stenotrophomonas]MCU1000810.1 GNAT family N-acetyltransferase [Stenotrophomonas maltophilia]MCU1069313.1 GNAT family N-acetyltransferase [Stenotrophomonas maltophilia]MCU1074158.1 GNAT family N-acetyltransferase [Stenotrophomonas maltophilia]MCU1137995.1 GNAT family N-acetyltransferase [Stenotrophomonas maltophilia]
MQVTLDAITVDNYEAVCDLEVSQAQQDFVAGNTWSLVQAAFNPGYQTRAILADGELVGFFMWVPETPQRTSIWRFMVDQRWQGRGIGRRALELALVQIRATPGLVEIEICYNPRNPVAGAFYSSFGFVETGMDEDGEDMLAVLPVVDPG